jgi:hypothetical protein
MLIQYVIVLTHVAARSCATFHEIFFYFLFCSRWNTADQFRPSSTSITLPPVLAVLTRHSLVIISFHLSLMSFPETTDTEPPVPSKDEEVPAAPAAAPDSTEEATKDVSAEPSSKPKKNKNHVKDYKTGISFSVHASPFRASVKSSSASLEPLKPIPAKYRLATEEDALSMSMLALRVAVLATACGQTVLQPNFPFLVLEGHPDAFPNTDPFGFSSALYFLPLTTMLGTAITSAVVGQLSDRIGRRPCILVCVGMMAITLVVQFFAQNTFWGFCAASFLNGLFCSSLPVAMAYAR